MRLLLLSSEFPPGPGGIGTHAYQLALHLHNAGWEIRVLAPQDYVSKEEYQRFNATQQFEIRHLPALPLLPLKAAHRWGLAALTAITWKPDLIIASGERAVWVAASLPRICPVVAIGHGSEFGLQGWQYSVTRWAFMRSVHVICVSNYTRQYMLKRGITPQQVSVIPNGADEKRFRPLSLDVIAKFRSEHRYDGVQLILTVGHVTERKGQRVVIEAMPSILVRCPKAHYLMAGLPKMQASLQQRAVELGINDHIHFLGQVDTETLLLLLNVCDIFTMTSVSTRTGDFEGYGIAVIEAALCGKPAIVSDNSGLPEAVVDQETGIVVPQNNPQRTAQAVIELLTNPDKRQRMGEAAYQRATGEQSWTHRAREYHSLLRSLIKP